LEQRFSKILFDCLAVEGELSVMERYKLGKTIAEDCLTRSMSRTGLVEQIRFQGCVEAIINTSA
jgi:hypothetical protein